MIRIFFKITRIDGFALRMATFYAAFFAFSGTQMPYLPAWLEAKGLDAHEIGIVLAMLARRDGYAYDIASRLADAIGMGEGTIYPLMRRMQTDGLVKTYLEESSSGPPRKYYQLTKAGHAALAAQKAEWNVFTASVARVLSDAKVAAPAAKVAGGVK